MKLTIGMAHYDDFYGAIFTIQSLTMHQDMRDTEILVVDNNPDSVQGKALQSFCEGQKNRRYAPIRYMTYTESKSTTQTRELIFREAKGAAVLCTDCHVLFHPGAIQRLKAWYDKYPDTRDLYHGPLLMTSIDTWLTHWNDGWRSGMWGVWGSAFECSCKWKKKFTTRQFNGRVVYLDLATSTQQLTACPACNKQYPPLRWEGHEGFLQNNGWKGVGFEDDAEPVEIPGAGLGVFTALKSTWMGFNPHFRSFGGEEMYIHAKYRLDGRKVIMLPFLKWWHRFERPEGIVYPISEWGKMRNYVLGAQELGLSLTPIHDHFISLDTKGLSLERCLMEVHSYSHDKLQGKSEEELLNLQKSKKMPQAWWDYLLVDPIRHEEAPNQLKERKSMRPQPNRTATLPEILEWAVSKNKRDLDEHLYYLKDLADKVEHVTAFEKRRESSVAFATSGAKTYVSYQKENDPLLQQLKQLSPLDYQLHMGVDSLSLGQIEETDLLFIDSVHSGPRVKAELDRHGPRVRRFIVFRGTESFGAQAEGTNEPGLFSGIEAWMGDHPEWFLADLRRNQYGMLTISKDPRDKPAKPILFRAPVEGPGTEFKKITQELGIEMPANCSCNALAQAMNIDGVSGCRERRDSYLVQIRENESKWGWTDKIANYIRAGANAIRTGLASKVNWGDPLPDLFDLAVKRAEDNENAKSKSCCTDPNVQSCKTPAECGRPVPETDVPK